MNLQELLVYNSYHPKPPLQMVNSEEVAVQCHLKGYKLSNLGLLQTNNTMSSFVRKSNSLFIWTISSLSLMLSTVFLCSATNAEKQVGVHETTKCQDIITEGCTEQKKHVHESPFMQ